jgi:hypothetical protein
MSEEIEGYLLYLSHAAGSKSDSVRPHLVMAANRVVRLHRPGSNPFSENEFLSWQGQLCRARGQWDQLSNAFQVETLEPVGSKKESQ